VCAAFAFHSVIAATGKARCRRSPTSPTRSATCLLWYGVGSTAMLAGGARRHGAARSGCLNVVGDTFNLLGPAAGAEHVGAVLNGIAWRSRFC